MTRLYGSLAVAAIGLSLACTTWLARLGQGPPRDRIAVPHQRHIAEEMECVTCHDGVEEASDLSERWLPAEDDCLLCHDDEKEKGNCSYCHRQPKQPQTYARRERHLILSHARHLPLVDEDCKKCHLTVPEEAAGARHTPTMETCLGCHDHQREYDNGQCQRCHVDLARFQLEPVAAFSHRGDFLRSHGLMAQSAADRCGECHDQTFCADCHSPTAAMPLALRLPERVDRSFIHRGDFVGRHALEATGDSALCRRCHGSNFCDSCHLAQNLVGFGEDPRRPHPVGWAYPGAETSHGEAARRDIASCAPCHDQGAASICVDCHRVGGIGGTPHPDGWTADHPAEEIETRTMCQICH